MLMLFKILDYFQKCVPSNYGNSIVGSQRFQSSSCQCYCHGLIDLPKVALDVVPFATVPFHADEVLHLVSSPVRSVYHPPLV
jgi:hypothetical protein